MGGLIGLARGLGINPIGEGIETVEQMKALYDHGCHQMQGYLFGKPVSAEEFAELRSLAQQFDGSLTPGEPIHQETRERISPFPGDVEPHVVPEDIQRGLEALGYIFDPADQEASPAPP